MKLFGTIIPYCYTTGVNKRADILNAALYLFVEQGEQATSMKWIAKEAKCGIGTMYNYFPSKENLINVLYRELKTKYINYVLTALDTDKPIRQQFIDTWSKSLKFTVNYLTESRFLEKFSHSPLITAQTKAEVGKLLHPLLEIFEKGKREGIIKNLDVLQLATFIHGAISATVLNKPEISSEDSDIIVLMAWDAIKS